MTPLDRPISYPPAPRMDQVDDYHGTLVADPYRWLEDPDTGQSRAWIDAQNALTFRFLESIPEREPLRRRLTELWDYEKWSEPFRRGDRYFVFKNDGLQNQSALYTMPSLDAAPRLLLDPNTLSPDGTVALSGLAISEDGALMAYGLSTAGSDWQEWKLREVATGADRPDHLQWIKFSGASWTHDGQGFFYSRYDEPNEATKFEDTNYFQKLFYHRVGTSQSEDVLVYDRPDQPEWGFSGDVTEDGDYLIVTVTQGTDPRNRVFYADLTDLPPQPPLRSAATPMSPRRARKGGRSHDGDSADSKDSVHRTTVQDENRVLPPVREEGWGGRSVELLNELDAAYHFIGNDGPLFWFQTDLDAPRGRVIAIDTREPAREHWREIIPQAEETLEGVGLVNDQFITIYLKDAHTRVRVFDLEGRFVRDVALPGLGTALGFGGRRTDTETFYAYTSFTTPTTIYRLDMATGESSVFRAPTLLFDPADYQTRQVFYPSRDGTRVPMFISHRQGLALDGNNPTYLYGYGGFNISQTPAFSVGALAWMELGGVFAVANLRGGGEYGEEWHQAGARARKQNVFDDFIAAGEWLIANGHTSPPKLAIGGGSNGGLLVAACLNQRPELFGAAVPAVGVMDMLRFHKFTIGWAWVPDYGSADDPEEFKTLYAYSPLHNIRPGTAYPSVLIITADHDDRVVPAHSFKYAAALQAAQAGSAPILIRIETKAGHGAGKPTIKLIEEAADRWAFLVKVLGMNG